MLAGFSAAVARIDMALGELPPKALSHLPDTADDVMGLRAILQRTTFALPEAHLQLLASFRAACDGVKAYAAELEEKCKDILQAVGGGFGVV